MILKKKKTEESLGNLQLKDWKKTEQRMGMVIVDLIYRAFDVDSLGVGAGFNSALIRIFRFQRNVRRSTVQFQVSDHIPSEFPKQLMDHSSKISENEYALTSSLT